MTGAFDSSVTLTNNIPLSGELCSVMPSWSRCSMRRSGHLPSMLPRNRLASATRHQFCSWNAPVPAEIFLVEVFRLENFHQWKISWKLLPAEVFQWQPVISFRKETLGPYQLKHSGQILGRANCTGSHGGKFPPEKIFRPF